MMYLRTIVICLLWQEYRKDAEELAERLRSAGLEIRMEPPEWIAGNRRVPEDTGTAETRRQSGNDTASLWVTDMSQMARTLTEAGFAVLAFLHERNREEDFGTCRYALESLSDLDTEYLERVYRRYKRLPWDILETKRCLVRETTEEDVEVFYRIYSDPSITRYMEGLYEDPEQERAYARDYIDKVYCFYNFGIWTVVEKNAGEVIGRAGICYREGYEEPEMGFVIAGPWQGRGYAGEVCEAILRYAREELGFSEILAFVRTENEVSMHICKKLGLNIKKI